jgi:hypothetical protein
MNASIKERKPTPSSAAAIGRRRWFLSVIETRYGWLRSASSQFGNSAVGKAEIARNFGIF